MSTKPRIGQHVRFTRHDHPNVPPGRGGMIDQLGSDNQFFVLTDCGGFFGWTSFDSWEATGEPDEVLNPEYVAMRAQALCDDSSIKAFQVRSSKETRMTTKAPATPDCELHAIDFIAHQLYMQSLNGGVGVLWLTMRDDLQEEWRTQAAKLFDDWRQHELERLRSRKEIDNEIARLVSQELP